ncbi:hypothetical protein AVEN_218629-1 [Araneus ventricosus]|uniref:Uncharacterized protein n=1 Tax=Araneus ventricosus TaxID=182803 RepID=A0A4Y2JSR6_ARAVE|nr:hypothetical protein AVEN_218629-1 [Araneus ventricosus]
MRGTNYTDKWFHFQSNYAPFRNAFPRKELGVQEEHFDGKADHSPSFLRYGASKQNTLFHTFNMITLRRFKSEFFGYLLERNDRFFSFRLAAGSGMALVWTRQKSTWKGQFSDVVWKLLLYRFCKAYALALSLNTVDSSFA